MHRLSIPAFYYPSTVLFVDDNYDFILNLVLDLGEDLAYRIFDSAFDTLDAIYKSNLKNNNQHVEKINLANLYQKIFNAKRFSEISVVIADAALPGMNGIDFFQRIIDSSLKKILLVDDTSIALAKNALNAGLIDCYIEKNDPDVSSLITKNIHVLQRQYFQTKSEKIRHQSINYPDYLNEVQFIDFFNQLVDKKRIVEHYLIDNSGHFLMLDDDARHNFLCIKTEKELNESKSLTKEWLPCEPFLKYSEENYFYSYTDKETFIDINEKGLCSYHQHLEALDIEELFSL